MSLTHCHQSGELISLDLNRFCKPWPTARAYATQAYVHNTSDIVENYNRSTGFTRLDSVKCSQSPFHISPP